jgi:hypothetical protein
MGYMRHHAIIVTSYADKIDAAHAKAVAIFDDMVTPVVKSHTNGYGSFMVVPDGSKERWEASKIGDACRDEFVEWLNTQRYSDDSTSLKWAEVQYGDDEYETRIVRDSDAIARSRGVATR